MKALPVFALVAGNGKLKLKESDGSGDAACHSNASRGESHHRLGDEREIHTAIAYCGFSSVLFPASPNSVLRQLVGEVAA
jgi:hypothetical protein